MCSCRSGIVRLDRQGRGRDPVKSRQIFAWNVVQETHALTGDSDYLLKVIVTDLRMKDTTGMDVLQQAKNLLPDAEVIVVTGHGTIQSAVEAMQQGAFNYLLKPLDLKQLRLASGDKPLSDWGISYGTFLGAT